MAREGHAIVATDLVGSAADAVATRIRDEGGEATALTLDVTSDESIREALDQLTLTVDVLINNAGIQHVARLEAFAQTDWDRLVDVILSGACRVTRAVMPGMRQAEWGRVINIGSIHSLVASPYKSAYVAAKHGLLGFSRTIALETADTDITINTICPSYVKTPLVEKQIRLQAAEHGIPEEEVIAQIMLKPMPKGVFISMEELVGAAAFLISPAARNITGQELVIDGGWTCR